MDWSLPGFLKVFLKMTGAVLLAVSIAACSASSNGKPTARLSFCQQQLLQQKLKNRLIGNGIQVIQQGEQVTLILPADKFFYGNSNHLDSGSDVYLAQIIRFVNTYPAVAVQVTGYTDNIGDALRNLALSRAQAQAVASYLWSHGLTARMISAQGKGCRQFVASNYWTGGRAANRRIEIFFRLPPPDNVFH